MNDTLIFIAYSLPIGSICLILSLLIASICHKIESNKFDKAYEVATKKIGKEKASNFIISLAKTGHSRKQIINTLNTMCK